MPILATFPGGGSGGSGLTLGAVTNISTLVSSGKVYIQWTDPEDMVLSGATLATWGGTLLVRKAGSMPASRRDGTIVIDSQTRDAYSASYFTDSGLTNDVTYYYKFFPYTTDGAYTDSTDNEFTATPTAQVTGIADWAVTNITATASGNGKMTVTWTDPASTITSDGVTLATWASTTIVVKEGSYATSKDDADAAYTLVETTRNQYASSGLQITGLTNGTTYYISFFPTTTDGGVNDSETQQATGVPNRMAISSTPSQSGSLTYSGSAQSPSWSNYNTTYMTIGGTTSATNAGSYTATFTPTTDYMWGDETTTAKSVSWTIGKATGSLSISPTSITLSTDNLSDTISVTRSGDGTITATSSNTSVATVSVSGTTVTVTNVNQATGTATVTVSVAAGTNYTAPSSKTCSVTASFFNKTLEEATWAEISQYSATGANYWAVGDRKSVSISGTVGTLSVSGTYYVYILGFNHNSSIEGTGITFGGFKTASSGGVDICFTDSQYNSYSTDGTKYFNMNHSSNTNSGGWKGCDLRYDVLGSTNTDGGNATTTTATSPVSGTLMAALPSALRAVMKAMTIYTDNTGGGSDTASYVTTSVDYLPLLSEYEVQGSRSYANSAEQNYQAQYSYYSSGNSKVKYRHSSTSTAALWWLRSPYYNYSTYFCRVGANGGASYTDARSSYGVAPAFRV